MSAGPVEAEHSGVVDVEAIVEELYGLRPEQFTAARDAYAAEAREARDPEAAKAIAALRRPVTAAWAANLLARRRPEEAQRFLALAETLREAHRTLDAEQLRAASRQRHQLVATLARTAAGLAAEEGQPVSDTVLHAVEQTLHGVLAHPDVAEQWEKGRLAKVPEAAVGFPAINPQAAPAQAPDKKPPQKQKQEQKREQKQEQKQGRAEEERLRDLERARTAASEADARVALAEQSLAEAREARQSSATAAEDASEQARRLEHELQAARQRTQQTKAESAEAARAVKAAETEAREARRAAERARREVERLER